MKKFSVLLFVIPLVLPIFVSAECSDSDFEDRNRSGALKLKLIALASILSAGVMGVCFPALGKVFQVIRPENSLFFFIKAFAAGVILSTGFIHVLPDAFKSLNSPCLPEKPWGEFPFAGLVAMLAAIGTMMVDSVATSFYEKLHSDKKPMSMDEDDVEKLGEDKCQVHVHTQATHGHAHGPVPSPVAASGKSDLTRRRINSQVLELGILFHSVIIGVFMGASQSPNTTKPLVAALSFHQLFEGMGLGGCIVESRFEARAAILMAIIFSLTTPIGIAIGIGISNIYHENSPTALIVEGIFNSASAGILIYMAQNLIAADSKSAKHNSNLQIGANISLLLGAGLMSLLAIWA